MTQQTDHERLDAIHQKVDAGCCGAMYLDVQFLLARLAALEHEREELRAELTGTLSEAFQAVPACYDTPADHYREMARRLIEDRDVQKHRARHAEAALLSLQTAARKLRTRIECDVPRYVLDLVQGGSLDGVAYMRVSTTPCEDEYVRWDDLAALLPDPAGTQLTKHDDDDHARVDREQLSDRPRTAPTERR